MRNTEEKFIPRRESAITAAAVSVKTMRLNAVFGEAISIFNPAERMRKVTHTRMP